MWGNGGKEKDVDMEFFTMRMEVAMKDFGKIMKKMDLVL